MTTFTIPARNDLPYYQFKITLSGISYTLVFRLNGRMNRWILDVNDASNNQIMSGLPLLILRNIWGQYRTLALPEGIAFVTDNTLSDSQPTQFSFGLVNTFYYQDPTQ